MIVPSITAALALFSVVSAVAPAHVRRQTVNASPAQALAASVQANAVISQIIIVIVQQAAAAAAAISSASVARTAIAPVTSVPASSSASSVNTVVSTPLTTTSPAPVTTAPTTPITTSSTTQITTTTTSSVVTSTSSSTSSTSSTSTTSSAAKSTYTPPTRSSSLPPQSSSGTSTSICLAPTTTAGSDTTPLPNIINSVAAAPVCKAICQKFIDDITDCVNNGGDNAALARCSCQTGFIQDVAKCAVCIDSYLGRQRYAYGNATYFCQQCSATSLQLQPKGACGSNSDLSFCGLNAIPPATICPSGSGSPYPGAPCNICQAGTYSLNSKCVYCQNDSQYSASNSSSCINCNSTLGVQTCNTYNNGYAESCTSGFHLYTDVSPPLCLPNCAVGAGVDPTTNTCYACPAGTRVNNYRCTACIGSYSLGNSTYCSSCPFNGLTQMDSTCSVTTGAPQNCRTNFALAGSLGNFTCAACTAGTSSLGGAQKCA